MSYNVPILFEDSPFFEGDTHFGRQRRNNRETAERRRPDLFQTWAKYDPIFDDPREDLFSRKSYRSRPVREVLVKPSSEQASERRFEENDEDIDDTQELSGVTGDMRGLYGLDGWDVPVQFVGSPESGNRCASKPQTRSRKHNVEEEERKQRAHKVANGPQRAKNSKDKLSDEIPVKSCDRKTCQAEKVETRIEEPETVPSIDDKGMDSNESSKENDSSTEIPVQRSYRKEKPTDGRRQSRRLSQCDPPPLAEIKIVRIQSIVQKTDGLEEKIKEFVEPIQNKNFLYISETLMSALLDLDKVDSEGIDMVRKARKEGVKTIQNLVEKLENKLAENKRNEASK